MTFPIFGKRKSCVWFFLLVVEYREQEIIFLPVLYFCKNKISSLKTRITKNLWLMNLVSMEFFLKKNLIVIYGKPHTSLLLTKSINIMNREDDEKERYDLNLIHWKDQGHHHYFWITDWQLACFCPQLWRLVRVRSKALSVLDKNSN